MPGKSPLGHCECGDPLTLVDGGHHAVCPNGCHPLGIH